MILNLITLIYLSATTELIRGRWCENRSGDSLRHKFSVIYISDILCIMRTVTFVTQHPALQ